MVPAFMRARPAAKGRSMVGVALAALLRWWRSTWLLAVIGFGLSLAGTMALAEDGAGQEASLPAPGSYRLEKILRVPVGKVLDSGARVQPLRAFTTGKITLLSFIYTSCSDSNGCPMAYATFHQLKTVLEADPALRDKVRFVSLSFDPEHDTPKVMREYGGMHAQTKALEWQFLTTRSRRELLPLLDGFGQDVAMAQGPGAPQLSHLLKVFLIDTHGQVREIYSPAFLLLPVLYNDIQTLLLEQPTGRK